ncbi:NfeD family protein [Clostridium weizhouense]|uniref:NfeD family protein n=1 Tax=Clostridium weizhouense TaxID=2859781 RepID=A0ABS7AMJ9_9CLOT|nr:NfeD family protein [Clostridium weizhouense]MBW6409881.1 NfeD family protein [Clostridium weizhouense]
MTSLMFWIILGISAFLVDVFTSSFLFVWFSIGAITAIIAATLDASFLVQVVIFLVVSIIATSIGYPLIKKKYKNSAHKIPLMEETYIGKEQLAEEEIHEKGIIKVGGIYWTVINLGDSINAGEKFCITGIQGTKLKIKKIEGGKK